MDNLDLRWYLEGEVKKINLITINNIKEEK